MVFDELWEKSYFFPSNCVMELQDILKREGGIGLAEQGVRILSLDDLERKNKPGAPLETVDMSIAVKDRDSQKNARFLFCEFKFRQKNVGNLKKKDLEDKVLHSRSLLDGNSIDNKVYFLFSKEQYQRARNLFERNFYSSGRCKGLRIVQTEKSFVEMLSVARK